MLCDYVYLFSDKLRKLLPHSSSKNEGRTLSEVMRSVRLSGLYGSPVIDNVLRSIKPEALAADTGYAVEDMRDYIRQKYPYDEKLNPDQFNNPKVAKEISGFIADDIRSGRALRSVHRRDKGGKNIPHYAADNSHVERPYVAPEPGHVVASDLKSRAESILREAKRKESQERMWENARNINAGGKGLHPAVIPVLVGAGLIGTGIAVKHHMNKKKESK